MNDDFLRRARRAPSAAFERQLRERLRAQELSEPSRRRPSFRLLAIALLIGGTALATATYLTMGRSPSPPPASQAPVVSAPPVSRGSALETNRGTTPQGEHPSTHGASPASTQQRNAIATARDNRPSPTDSQARGEAQSTRYVSSTGMETSRAATRRVRIVASPDIAPLAKHTSPGARFAQSATFETDSADSALPTLCAEDVAAQPDMVITSRRVRRQELKLCATRHTGEVLEATIGHVAVVVTRAKSGTPMQLSTRTLRLALLKQVPSPDNSSLLIDNPYTHWNQIEPELEERRIELLGPARDSPEFIVLAATLLAPACELRSALDQEACQALREDGVYTEARFDSAFVGQRLWANPDAVAIIDYRFYVENDADLLGSLLPGAAPTRESILDGSYVGARKLHAYVNRLRHGNIAKVSSVINEYLRMPAHLNHKVVLPPDGNLQWPRPYTGIPKLTEVKLD